MAGEDEWIAVNNELEQYDGLDFNTASLNDMVKSLHKFEGKKQELIEDIRVIRIRLEEEKADQSDVYYYLHKKLDDNYDVISALERQLMVETADREKAETEFARRIDDIERRRDDELGPLKENLITSEEQLNLLHDAAEHKRETDATRERLEKELKSTRSVIEDDLAVERRKKLQEKQRVRTQMEIQIKELNIELLSKKEVELADKTVRAADNNEKLHLALQAKGKQAERMMIINQGLAFENSNLRNDVDLAKASEAVLGKRVNLYHDLVIGLKAQLEQEVTVDKDEEQELADLEESLAGSGDGAGSGAGSGVGRTHGGTLDTMSLTSDETPGAQVVWAGGACGGLVYESVDELRVAVESLQHLHVELKQEAQQASARVEQSTAAAATESATFGPNAGDPLVACLLETADKWMVAAGLMPVRSGTAAAAVTPMQEAAPARAKAPLEAVPPFKSPQLSCRASELGFPKEVGGGNNSAMNGRGDFIQSIAEGSINSSSSSGGGSPRKRRTVIHHEQGKVEHGRRGRERGRREERCRETRRERKDRPTTSASLSGSDGQMTPTAAVAICSEQRRQLFYALVDALRNFQMNKVERSRRDAGSAPAAVGGGEENAGSTEDKASKPPENALDPERVQATCVHKGNSACGEGEESPAIVKPCGIGEEMSMSVSLGIGGGRGDIGLYGEGSTSDLSSVSVKTLHEFGPPELRSVSTQTIAKHFPEKFAVVPPARKLVVNGTFLTSNSLFSSASTTTTRGLSSAGGLFLPASNQRSLRERMN